MNNDCPPAYAPAPEAVQAAIHDEIERLELQLAIPELMKGPVATYKPMLPRGVAQ